MGGSKLIKRTLCHMWSSIENQIETGGGSRIVYFFFLGAWFSGFEDGQGKEAHEERVRPRVCGRAWNFFGNIDLDDQQVRKGRTDDPGHLDRKALFWIPQERLECHSLRLWTDARTARTVTLERPDLFP